MRTTLELDDDLAYVARQLASQREMTMGKVVSELVCKALEPKAAPRMRNGVPLFATKPGGLAQARVAQTNRALGLPDGVCHA